MTRLIDPTKYKIVKSYCRSGGVDLHEIKDCPKDRTCPVWVSVNRPTEADLIRRLRALVKEWETSFCHTENPDYGQGFDSGKESAAGALEEELDRYEKERRA